MRELFDRLTPSPDMASNSKRTHLKYPKSLSEGLQKIKVLSANRRWEANKPRERELPT